MSRILRWIAFILIEVVLLPITIAGTLLLIVHFALDFLSLAIRGKRISIAVYDLLFARWMLDVQGKRKDKAARKLLYAMPGVSPLTVWPMLGPTLWAMHATDVAIHIYDYPVHSSSNLVDALGHRTPFFDDALLAYLDKGEQVVILGAGWDTRAYGLARREGMRVFEVDVGKTQTQKLESLEKANIDTADVIFAAADFNKESWLDALLRVGFDPDKPTLVLWEGVTHHLEAEGVEATLQTVAKDLTKGSVIAFDYQGKHIVEGDASLFYRIAVPGTRLVGEPWTFGICTKDPAKENLSAFLDQNGLTLAGYEPIGKGDKKGRLDGGLALAVNY